VNPNFEAASALPTHPDNDIAGSPPAVQVAQRAAGERPGVALTGQWTTLGLLNRITGLEAELAHHSAKSKASWDLSKLERLDHTGALLLWRTWGRVLPENVLIPTTLRTYFTRLSQQTSEESERREPKRGIVLGIEHLGRALIGLGVQVRDIVGLIGRMLLDLVELVRRPQSWPVREITAGVFRAGPQAMGILALVGFLIGVVLSYLSGDQLRRFGADLYVVNLLGIGCVREIGPLLAAILVAGRSGSSITAQLGVMRLNEELDALTTIGIAYTQRLVLPKVLALAISQPLVGLWTSGVALAGGMVAAHFTLGVGYTYFLDAIPGVVPIANYWIGLGKGVVFGAIIALVACHFGLRIKPNTESLGAGTTRSVVVAITCVLVADAVFAVLFSHVGI
jgi:phospholipid/cholesterol/gamma-HCH transport system permease protein